MPGVSPLVPTRGSALGRLIGRLMLRGARWRVRGELPELSRMVIIVAPHTSNWDFVVGFGVYLALDLEARWFGKHTLFRWPIGPLLRRFGGIPIEREGDGAADVVDRSVREFESRERLLLALTPEGTRRKVDEWKSGFYRIAVRTGVPIVPVGFDYRRHEVIVFPPFRPTGDWAADIPRIKAIFGGVTARHPQQF